MRIRNTGAQQKLGKEKETASYFQAGTFKSVPNKN